MNPSAGWMVVALVGSPGRPFETGGEGYGQCRKSVPLDRLRISCAVAAVTL